MSIRGEGCLKYILFVIYCDISLHFTARFYSCKTCSKLYSLYKKQNYSTVCDVQHIYTYIYPHYPWIFFSCFSHLRQSKPLTTFNRALTMRSANCAVAYDEVSTIRTNNSKSHLDITNYCQVGQNTDNSDWNLKTCVCTIGVYYIELQKCLCLRNLVRLVWVSQWDCFRSSISER